MEKAGKKLLDKNFETVKVYTYQFKHVEIIIKKLIDIQLFSIGLLNKNILNTNVCLSDKSYFPIFPSDARNSRFFDNIKFTNICRTKEKLYVYEKYQIHSTSSG